MEITLDDYIAKKPELQSFNSSARMSANRQERTCNSEEFMAQSTVYTCEDMDLENSYKMANVCNAEIFDSKKKKQEKLTGVNLDREYLTLDLTEEDEYENWFGSLKSQFSTSADNCTDTNNGRMQPERFNLNQVANGEKQDEHFNPPLSQWCPTPFHVDTNPFMGVQPIVIKNNKNKLKRKKPRNAGSNRFGRNAFCQPKYSKFGNPLLWVNQNDMNNYATQTCACCSFQNVPKLLFGQNTCGLTSPGNGINGNSMNLNMNGRSDQFLFGQNTFGLTSPGNGTNGNSMNLNLNGRADQFLFGQNTFGLTSPGNGTNGKPMNLNMNGRADQFLFGQNTCGLTSPGNGTNGSSMNLNMNGRADQFLFGQNAFGLSSPGNGINGNPFNLNMNGRADQLLHGHNACGLTSPGPVNTPLNSTTTNIVGSGCNSNNNNSNWCPPKNNSSNELNGYEVLKKLLNLSSNDSGIGCTDNKRFNTPSPQNLNSSQQNNVNQTQLANEDRSNVDKNLTTPNGNNITQAFGAKILNLELSSTIALLEHIYHNGITINLFPEKNSAIDSTPQSKQ